MTGFGGGQVSLGGGNSALLFALYSFFGGYGFNHNTPLSRSGALLEIAFWPNVDEPRRGAVRPQDEASTHGENKMIK